YSYSYSSLPSLLVFSFQCSRPPRDLHSFPTRRSSDLPGFRARRFQTGRSCDRAARQRRPTRSAARPSACSSGTLRCSREAARERSEEHTSELQSRGHLVCRLLLEKKKRRVTSRKTVTD